MTRYVVGTLLMVLIGGSGCAARPAAGGQGVASPAYQLMCPPDVRDENYPGGVHVQADAPLAAWRRVAAFATREECESSRLNRIDESIDKARVEVGDQAKYQLPVRLAVNARCVTVR